MCMRLNLSVLSDVRQPSRAPEHGVHHRLGEFVGERVLLARVEAAEQDGTAVGQREFRTVGELRARAEAVKAGRGRFAKPFRCIEANSQSPERSPVKTRPVRFPPWAAGARPSTYTRARGSPKPGTGRPQYSSFANDARFSRATRSRHSTSRGQR